MAEKIPSPVRFLIGITRALLDEVATVVRDPVSFNALRAELGLEQDRPLDRDTINEVNDKLLEADARLGQAADAPDNDLSIDENLLDFLLLGPKVAEIVHVIVGDAGTPEKVSELTYLCLGVLATERIRLRKPMMWALNRLVMLGYERAEEVPRFNPVEIFERLSGERQPVYADPFGSYDVLSGLLAPPLLVAMGALADMAELKPHQIAHLPKGRPYFDGKVGFKLGWEPDPDTPAGLAVMLSRALTVSVTADLKVKGHATAFPVTFFFTAMPVPAQEARDGVPRQGPGLMMRISGKLAVALDLDAGAPIRKRLDLTLDSPAGVNYFWDFERKTVTRRDDADGNASGSLAWSARGTEDAPAFRHLLGKPGHSRLDIVGVEVKGRMGRDGASLGFGLREGKVVLDAHDLVPELAHLFEAIGAERFEARLDAALKYDFDEGRLAFEGEAGFKIRLFPHADFKIGRLDYLDLLIGVKDKKLVFGLETAAKLMLGPVAASIDRFGFTTPADGGKPSFHPPKGIGLRMDFALVKGGGFLLLDYEKKRFAGALQLSILGASVNAIAILSAGTPGNDADFALFTLLYARFPGGLELGLRFTLNAIGGLVGINHGFDIAALEKALPSGAMDDVLFPDDPVGDAPRIIASLTTIFPVRRAASTFGFMLELGWGLDRFCSMRLGLIVPVGSQARPGDSFRYVYLLGRISVVCFEGVPKPARMQITCDFIGEVGLWVQSDPFKMRFSIRFYARMRDSRIGPTSIEGAVVFSMRTGPGARLLLAAGGFHPGFKNVPEDLPSPIDRMGTSYDIGVIKAWMRAYFAIASGTLQFGFSIGCRYKADPIAFRAELGADALIHLSPFSFEVGCNAHAALTYRGHELMGVHLALTLWGPDRWRIKGRGDFNFLGFDVPVSFDESWGSDVEAPAPSIRLDEEVRKDLHNLSNWSYELPGTTETLVNFGAVAPPADPAHQLAHPLAILRYSQRRIPFGTRLERLSFGRIEGPDFFPVPQVLLGGVPLPGAAVQLDQFAMPEFLNLSDEDRLTRPSFETLPSGIATGAGGFQVPAEAAVEATLEQELVLKLTGSTGQRFAGLNEFEATNHLSRMLLAEAAGRSPMQAAAFRHAKVDPVVSRGPAWTAVERETLAPGLPRDAVLPAWTSASPTAMAATAGQRLQVVETFELVE